MLIAQISDTHVVAAGGSLQRGQVDPNTLLERAVERLNALRPRPDLVLVTGDLTNHGSHEAYVELKALLARLELPFYLAIGNHDERGAFLAELDYPHLAACDGFVQYVVDDHPVRLIVLDSTSEAHHHGEFCAARLDWLVARLEEGQDRPTIVAVHHPPFDSGMALMDGPGPEWADGLIAALAGRRNILRVVCGHIHRSMQALVGGHLTSVCPSTAQQLNLDLSPGAPDPAHLAEGLYALEPPGFHLHAWDGERLVTHSLLVDRFPCIAPVSERTVSVLSRPDGRFVMRKRS